MLDNLPKWPDWYDQVADQLLQGNGRRTLRPLMEYLDLAGIEQWRDQARSPEKRRRWDILWHYAQHPAKQAMASKLGVRWALVDRSRRLLTESQEQHLRGLLDE